MLRVRSLSASGTVIRDFPLGTPVINQFAVVNHEHLATRDEVIKLRRLFKEGGPQVVFDTDLPGSPMLRVPVSLEPCMEWRFFSSR